MHHSHSLRIATHRDAAHRARRLSRMIDDRQAIACMNDIAWENDQDADRLEADLENESRILR